MVYEVLMILCLTAFLITERISLLCEKRPLESPGEIVWHMMDVRRNEHLDLEQKTYLVSNVRGTDIYLDTLSEEKLKLLFDVRRDCIYITILQGTVTIAGCRHRADPHTRIRVDDESMRFHVHLGGNIDLTFRRER